MRDDDSAWGANFLMPIGEDGLKLNEKGGMSDVTKFISYYLAHPKPH